MIFQPEMEDFVITEICKGKIDNNYYLYPSQIRSAFLIITGNVKYLQAEIGGGMSKLESSIGFFIKGM